MTALQYGTMKYIRREQPSIEIGRIMSQRTLSSLFYNGWITVIRGSIRETADGSRELDKYVHAKMAERQVEADLSKSVERYMRNPRRNLIVMKRRNAA